MEVMRAIRNRRSIRSYQDRMIEDDKLHLILEAGRLAPSASNRQERKFIVVKGEEAKRKLAAAAQGQSFIGEAPVVIVACALETEYTMLCGQKSYPIDIAIAVDHMTLKAVEEGLGTCWIGAFREDEVKKILDVPKEVRVVSLLPVGYPQNVPEPTPRKSEDEVIVFEKWA